MSDASPTGLTAIDDVEGGGHTLVFSSRLVMAANTTLQLSLLFAFLYLRANNFGGAWHPSGIGTPPQVLALISLAFPVIGVLALWAVWNAVSKSRESSAITGLLWLALLAAVLTGAVRILLMYQFNWELDSAGTYADIATLWYAVLLGEFIGVGLWLLSLVMGHVRGTDRLSTSHARAILEQWTYITGVSIAVYLLVQYAT
jgi:small basic protein